MGWRLRRRKKESVGGDVVIGRRGRRRAWEEKGVGGDIESVLGKGWSG